MGRHGAPRSGGRLRSAAILVVPALTLVLAAGGGYAWWSNRASASTAPPASPAAAGCAEPLEVLVSSELGPVVRDLLAATDAQGCRLARVGSASAPAAIQQIGGGRVPEVWVPDSSTWVDALPGTGDQPTSPGGWVASGSVASSPVLLVSPT